MKRRTAMEAMRLLVPANTFALPAPNIRFAHFRRYAKSEMTDSSRLAKGINLWSQDTIERAIEANDIEGLSSAVIAVSMHEEDQKYSELLCVRLSQHPHFNVRGNAILGFGHIARVHGKLNQELVYPIIADALKDENDYIRGQAECAKDDTTQFLGWKYEN